MFCKFVRKSIVMNTKLTLSLDKEVIEQAKAYAKERGMSLSKFVENFLKASTVQKEPGKDWEKELSPLIKSLSGVIPPLSDKEVKKEYMKHLEEKYG